MNWNACIMVVYKLNYFKIKHIVYKFISITSRASSGHFCLLLSFQCTHLLLFIARCFASIIQMIFYQSFCQENTSQACRLHKTIRAFSAGYICFISMHCTLIKSSQGRSIRGLPPPPLHFFAQQRFFLKFIYKKLN